MLQIAHLLKRRPSQLSGGQRQRVAMGRALVRNPQVFLFDEPLSNLDAKLSVDMRTEIKRLHQRMGTTIVYVTHDQIEAMTLAYANRGLEGRSAAAIRLAGGDLQPARQYVRCGFHGLAGHEPYTGAAGKLQSGAACSRDRARRGHRPCASISSSRRTGFRLHAGREIIFGIRPEALTDPDSADRNARRAVEGDCLIEVVEPAGSDTFAVTRLGRQGNHRPAEGRCQCDAGQTASSYSISTRPCSSTRASGERIS